MTVPYTFATATSAIPLSNLDSNFATAITIGSTAVYLGNTTTTIAGLTLSSPTLTTPALGTPSSGTLTNCTGLPVSTGVSGLGTGVGTFLATPSSANLATAVTDETGSGSLVFATSPTLVTPILGTPTSGTLTNCTGYTTANLSGTISNAQLANSSTTINGTSIALGASGTVTAAAGTLTGTTLNSTVVTSSLTAVGTIATGVWNGTAIAIANGGTGQTTKSAAFNALSPITTTGDLIIGNGTNSATRLAIGANTYVLTSDGTTASWVAPSGGGGTQATATALGTVYALQNAGGATPFLTAFGYNAGVANTGSGGRNTAVGYSAMQANTSGNYNVAVGMNALYSNVTGSSNTAIGQSSLFANTNDNNTAVGYAVLQSNTSGTNNVGVGSNALQSNTTGSENTAVGYQALYLSNSSSGGFCTAFGFKSGNTITTGYGDVMLGYMCQPSAATSNYEIVIGTVGGNCFGKGGSTGFISPNGGGVYQGNNSSSWSTTSDRRLKKNIVDNTIGLDAINAIQVRNFEYRTEDEVTELPKHSVIKKEGVQIGAIAQELQQVLPDCVKTETTGVLSVDTTNITWHLINAVKELSAELNALKAKVGA